MYNLSFFIVEEPEGGMDEQSNYCMKLISILYL